MSAPAGQIDSGLTEQELARIADAMQAGGVGLAGPLQAGLITGGRSNLTYRLTDGEARWVMRTPPRAGRTPSAHDVAREYRVTAALGQTDVPVAPAVVLCEDESLIGGPFAVAEFVSGSTIQTREDMEALDGPALQAAVADLVATLAALHRVDHVAIGLERFGRPDGYAERQLKRWTGQWELVGSEELRPLADELSARLAAAVPEQRATGIVHGDFRIDNTILDLKAGPRVAAVVDWELSTIGDPVADVAMMCAYRHPVFDLIVGEPSAWASDRLPEPDDLAAAYEAADGVRLADWDFHLALAYFKIGVIAAGIDYRVRAGAASGRGFDTTGATVETYLDLGLKTLGGRSKAGGRGATGS
ncbi:phosphotransferase family protein [Actinomadura sp. 7K534]|uniref:phosphotransferase family protein n=1 Tax=Actinomadura sp. 7K534 TaxID=2530366 RepID=UPI001A9CEADD|nr:phosphotransferase family protein [Actinomadura sp. 7K534]